MTAKTKTISLTNEQDEFLIEKNLSASAIFQGAVDNLMEMSKVSGVQLREEIRKRENFQKVAEDARKFIEKKGLMEEYLKDKGYL